MTNKISLYINWVLFAILVVLLINTFSVTGHELIQRALAAVGNITGEGSVNYGAKFVGAQSPSNIIGNSIIYDNGTNVGIGTAAPTNKLDVNGGITSYAIYLRPLSSDPTGAVNGLMWMR